MGAHDRWAVRVVVVTTTLFGLAVALLTPPAAGFDERAHFLRTYEVSDGAWLPRRAGALVGYGSMPAAVPRDLFRVQVEVYAPGRDHAHFLDRLWDPAPQGQRDFVIIGAIAGYSPVAYLPGALAVGIGRLLNVSTLMLLYFARLGNLVAYVVLCALAVRRTPTRPWLFVVASILPIGVFGGATVAPDGVTFALVLLLLAQALRAALAPTAWRRADTMITVVASVALGLAKPPYSIALIAVALAAFRLARRPRIIVGVGALGGLLAAVAWNVAMQTPLAMQELPWGPVASDDRFAPFQHVDSTRQLVHQVVLDPLGFLGVIGRSVGRYGGDWVREPATQMGLVHAVPMAVVMAAWAALVLGAVARPGRALDRAARIVAALLALGIVAVTIVGAYTTWNAVGSPYVRAFQPRYFYPALVPLALAVTPRRAQLRTHWGFVAVGLSAAALAGYLDVLLRYYY